MTVPIDTYCRSPCDSNRANRCLSQKPIGRLLLEEDPIDCLRINLELIIQGVVYITTMPHTYFEVHTCLLFLYVQWIDRVYSDHPPAKKLEGISPFDHLQKRLTNFPPIISLTTLAPPETAGQDRSARYTGRRVSIYANLFFPVGIPGRLFFKFDMGKDANVYCWWMVGFELTPPKPIDCRRRHYLVKELEGIRPFDHLQKVSQLPTQTK